MYAKKEVILPYLIYFCNHNFNNKLDIITNTMRNKTKG